MKRVKRNFYLDDTVEVARNILGKVLVRKINGRVLSGRITEAEAYTGPGDPASHAFRGPTPRSRIMFGPPGRAYVYFCYGNHYLLNAVTREEGEAGAVLIRGLEPLEGIKRIMKNRKKGSLKNLLDGPGKLTQGLEINLSLNGEDMVRGDKLYLAEGELYPGEQIIHGHRIGIKEGTEKLWRFFLRKAPG